MADLIHHVNAFRAAFARRQAAETVELPGAVVVRDREYPFSEEHNCLIVDGPQADPAALPGLAARHLGERRRYAIATLDEEIGERATPALAAAGYQREDLVLMARDTAGCVRPEPAAAAAELAELRDALLRQNLVWFPDEDSARQLTDRRAVRLRGAEEVRFLAAREPDGRVAAWADLYLDRRAGLAQVEDLVTAEAHRGRGHGDTLLGTALALAAAAGIPRLFLIADAEDWPREWYARRGFTEIGRSHLFHGG
ncbi:GNAT family N-acetyltransferase [Streptomyces sp. Y1]|uniref:GNAT family N-acetyltransferase n=1 Tax=Streptomyces sp. Y1 TaxID=3238634 RepID=A0AB39TCK4_9ACTN